MNISQKLKEIRKRLNLTGEQIGKMAGVSRSYVARLESGEIPSLERAFMIEKALRLNGEISDLVIDEAKKTAGIQGPTLAPLLGNDSGRSAGLNLDSIWLSHKCLSCGTKAPIKISIDQPQ